MKHSIHDYLINIGYTKVKLHATKTNHFEIKAAINNQKGTFIVDTGASNTCIGINMIEKFKLSVTASEIKAAGAGALDMETQISMKNSIKIGKWKWEKLKLVIFDLTHVNTALVSHNASPVDGIIGADILKKGNAIIDYKYKYMYLKLYP